jgi:hypothetical protein
VKEIKGIPAGNPGIYQKRLFLFRMPVDTGQPMKKKVQTQRTDPGRQLDPKRPNCGGQKEAVVALFLVKRKKERYRTSIKDGKCLQLSASLR